MSSASTLPRARVVLDTLEDMILRSRFAPGERLDEKRLSETFEVSRTPVREAFQQLAASGLVELIPRRGAFVRRPSLVEIVEMFEVMAELEALCGRHAARRASVEAIDAIAALCDDCMRAAEAWEPDAYYRVNERFHHAIYEASGSTFLALEAERLHRRLRPFRRTQLQAGGRLRQSSREHGEVVQALRDGDAERAADILRRHIKVQGDRLTDLVAAHSE